MDTGMAVSQILWKKKGVKKEKFAPIQLDNYDYHLDCRTPVYIIVGLSIHMIINYLDSPRGMLASKLSSYAYSARVQSKIALLFPQSKPFVQYLLS
jgi:hypothetical protein